NQVRRCHCSRGDGEALRPQQVPGQECADGAGTRHGRKSAGGVVERLKEGAALGVVTAALVGREVERRKVPLYGFRGGGGTLSGVLTPPSGAGRLGGCGVGRGAGVGLVMHSSVT